MKKLETLLASALFALPVAACATHYEPWVKPTNEVEVGADYSYQWYRHLKFGSHPVKFHDENQYLHISLSDTIIENLNAELEYSAFRSSALDNNFNSDYFKLTGRYQWLDNLCDDSISLSTAFSAIFPTEAGLTNTGEFHHSDADFELHVSLGKQFPADVCEQKMSEEGHVVPIVQNVRGMENYWVDVGLGKGVYGAAWSEVQAAGEKQFADVHFIRLRLDYNQGFGGQKLNTTDIDNYAHIRYSAVDLEARYKYEFGCTRGATGLQHKLLSCFTRRFA
jgi:hypothetical protein